MSSVKYILKLDDKFKYLQLIYIYIHTLIET